MHRKKIVDLKPSDIEKIRDLNLANQIKGYVESKGLKFEEALSQFKEKDIKLRFNAAVSSFSEEKNIHRCRVIENITVIPIKDSSGRIYKGYKGDGNYCYEIYQTGDGKWSGEIITSFEANQAAYKNFMADKTLFRKQSFSGHPLIMRLCNNDVIAIEDEGRKILRVVTLSAGIIALCEISESDVDARNRDKTDSFKYSYKSASKLKGIRARRVFIDPIGQVKDPGFSGA